MKLRPYLQRILHHRVIVMALVLTIVAGSLLTGYLATVAEKELRKDVGQQVNFISLALHYNLEDVERAVKALSQVEMLPAALTSGSPADLEQVNKLFDRFTSSFGVSVCYLLDRNGLTVASSNRNDKTGFTGRNFAFRTYFKGALAGRLSTDFVLGSATGERGYYAAAPVVDGSGAITGVVVIKRNIAPLEKAFMRYSRTFLVSPEGIIFISSREELLFRALWPVDDRRRSELTASRQFGNIRFEPLLKAEPQPGTYVRFENRKLFVQRLPFGSDGWTVVTMEPPDIVSNYRLFGILLTFAVGLLLLFVMNVLLNKEKTLEDARKLLKARDDWGRTFDAVPDLIAIIDNDYRILQINRSMADRLNISKESAIGRNCYELLYCSEVPCHICLHKDVLDSGRVRYTSRYEKNLNGHFVISASPIYAQDSRTVESTVHVMHNISDLIQMEQSLKEYAQRLELVLEGSNDATWEWDLIARKAVVNRRYYEMLEYAPGEVEIDFAFFQKTIHPEDVADVQRHIQEHLDGKTDKYEAQYRMVTKSGKLRHVMGRGKIVSYEEDGRPARVTGVITDVTKLKALGDEVHRIHNLESIGLLTGGLSHDFNNMLNVIYGNIAHARMFAGDNTAIAEPLADAAEACERAKEFGIRLQAFSQASSPVKERISLPAIIEEAATELFKNSTIVFTISAADGILPVEADPRQIELVFENLLTNAKEAMPDGGSVRIDISNYLIDAAMGIPLNSGHYVCIALQDEGVGIPQEMLPKIFDPYFSTKDTYSQRGMGLGLSICNSILKKHRGHINVESTVGVGTKVTVYLPAAVEETKPIPEGRP